MSGNLSSSIWLHYVNFLPISWKTSNYVFSSLLRVQQFLLKFIYSEKATKFCEIFTLLLTVCTVVKNKAKISQSFVAFSKYMNFNIVYVFVVVTIQKNDKIAILSLQVQFWYLCIWISHFTNTL